VSEAFTQKPSIWRPETERPRWRRDLVHKRAYYVMLAIPLGYLLVFHYLPIYGLTIAFKDFSVTGGILGSRWAEPWHRHFSDFMRGPYFSQILSNTFLISVLRIAFGMAPPVLLALILNECKNVTYKRFVQTVTYLPHFLSWVIIYGIVYSLLSYHSGLVNAALESMGSEKVSFLSSTDWFRPIVIGSDIWQGFGWGAIIYLAAIAGISPDLYDAAVIDGASRIQRIRYITLPSIKHIFIVLLILRIGRVFDAGFEQIFVFYNVQVYEVADIIDTWVYRTGLEQFRFSLATAVGLFKSLIGGLLIYVANRIARRMGSQLW
jgi:putative aldouronate transport system permease protein